MPRVYLSVAKQRAVVERAHSRCEYCQSQADYATETFAVEHIRPISRGGTSGLNNLALACSGCNGRKYNKTDRETSPSPKRNRDVEWVMTHCYPSGTPFCKKNTL
jgi:5-methylcytosine-specific restriction endonuclease McrA